MRHLTTFKLINKVVELGSIRKAAEEAYIAPSALHRRIQSFESELGYPIFDREHDGVRLNAAGELVIHHIRAQIADTERLQSRLADLSGLRRGHVTIACSQALVPYFLPREISLYRRQFPKVTFDILVAEHQAAAEALESYNADLALVFDTKLLAGFNTTLTVRQSLYAVVARNHPLAGKKTVRLRECFQYPLALPHRNFSGRQIIENWIRDRSLKVAPEIETNSFEFLKNYVLNEGAVTFQIPIGAPDAGSRDGLVSLPIDSRDVTGGFVTLSNLRGRLLPVAPARFADQIMRSLSEQFETVK